jgi:long-chain acyl-CoA synthetase
VKEQFKTSKGKYVAPAPIESKLLAHPAVEACCLMGAGHPSPFAIVLLSMEARSRCGDADQQRLLAESLHVQMQTVNADLDPHERVAFLAVVDGPWTIGNGLITPTLKIRRTALEDRYQELFDEWQRQESPVVWERIS